MPARPFRALVCALLLIGLRTASAQTVMARVAEAPPPAGAPAGWMRFRGQWAAEAGQVRVVSTEGGGDNSRARGAIGAIALFGRYRWQDYRVTTRVLGGTDVANVLVRALDPLNCVQFGHYGSSLRLEVFRAGRGRLVASTELPGLRFPEDLSAEIRGSEFRGYVDGKLLLQHTFQPDEIEPDGKAGLQTNHTGIFTTPVVDVTRERPASPNAAPPSVEQMTVGSDVTGPHRLQVRLSAPGGLARVATASYGAVALASGAAARAVGLPFPTEPLRLTGQPTPTAGQYVAPFFSLYPGRHALTVRVIDRDDNEYEATRYVTLRPTADSVDMGGGKRVARSFDPHPVWRSLLLDGGVSDDTISLSNYFWQVGWGPDSVTCRALTLEPQSARTRGVGRRIELDRAGLAVRPRIVLPDGKEVAGTVTRSVPAANAFGLRLANVLDSPDGRLEWWVDVRNGDPVLRFGGRFTPRRDMAIRAGYRIENGYGAVQSEPAAGWATGAHWVTWRPTDRQEGPLFCYALSRHPASGPLDAPEFASVPLRADQAWRLPVFAAILVDANVPYSQEAARLPLARTLAQSILAESSAPAELSDGPAADATHELVLSRPATTVDNDWDIARADQLFALPWCTAAPPARPGEKTGVLHSAFGSYAYLTTPRAQVALDPPVPDLAPARLTPPYGPIRGDWLDIATACIDRLGQLQQKDGTFARYERMDHYSLGRMTLGLMMGYRGLAAKPALQAKAGAMVRLALDRMLGLGSRTVESGMTIEKGFSGGTEQMSWARGSAYVPFTYHPQWDTYTEMGATVDQNLGHAHLLFTMLLYGAYVDPAYLRRPEVRDRLEDLIKFQWLSQDWNGDVWRVFLTGTDSAGGGDGYEEDLAMVLPRLAEMAALNTRWRTLASRVSAMKYGALLRFDYLPLKNEWGMDYLTPQHHPTNWSPEGGWDPPHYAGDVWYTGPAVCAGIYGPWYTDNVYRKLPAGVFRHMWYDLLEDARDTVREDGRHWLTIGGYCSEAQLGEPFLGAVKLMMAHDIALERGYLTDRTEGENIWNFAFYPAAMTVIQYELERRYPFMKSAVPVARAVGSSDPVGAPAYAWRAAGGATVSAAAYRLKSPAAVTLRLDAAKLGLRGARWTLTDVKTGAHRTIPANAPIDLILAPHAAAAYRVTAAR